MTLEDYPIRPSLPWRVSSSFIMAATGLLSKSFVVACSRAETTGLDRFIKLLDERQDIEGRQRGLITVSNHVSVLDDPMIWGVLPFRYMVSPDSLRWGLGSHDLCFSNKGLSTFFSLGQVLPAHRSAHSKYGGLFQPTMTQAIRLLSRGPFHKPSGLDSSVPDVSDPFSSAQLTYTTTGLDTIPAPSAYLSRRHSWVHIFPEGKVHQMKDRSMRYFKWGVARLILESEPCPDVVPMWIEGPDEAMHESREFPRFIPRPGKTIRVVFGERLDMEKVFGDLREKWRQLRAQDAQSTEGAVTATEVGVLSEGLKRNPEAVELRMECTMRVRNEVLKLRRSRGWPDEDPKARLVDTYRMEGSKEEGKMDDDSWVKDM